MLETTPSTKIQSLENNSPQESLDEKILRLQARLEAIQIEKARLLQTQREATPQDEKQKTARFSRRTFLKVAAGIAGGLIVDRLQKKGDSAEAATTENKTGEADKRKTERAEGPKNIEEEIADCKKIIENKEYERILENPFLVSALYYSDESMKKMSGSSQTDPEKIISAIYPLITREFREEYLQRLKKLVADSNLDITGESTPLQTLSTGKKLEDNHLNAIDLFIKEGSPVYSISGGIVVLAENGWDVKNGLSTSSARGGNTVIIYNPESESFSRYAHMSEVRTNAGTVLNSKQEIGIVGHTGINASQPGSGEHLHLEVNRYDRKTGGMVSTPVFELKRHLDSLVS